MSNAYIEFHHVTENTNNLEFVIGVSKYGTIYTAELRRTKTCGVSFNEYTPINIDEEIASGRYHDVVENYCDDLRECNPNAFIDCLVHYDCTPMELADNMEQWESIEQFYDLDSDWVDYNDEEIRFEFVACGQIDPRDNLEKEINPTINNLIFEYWDNYHLKACSTESQILWSRLVSAYNGTFYNGDLKKALDILWEK